MYIAATLFSDDDNFKNLQTYRKGMPRRLSLLDQGFRVLGLYEEDSVSSGQRESFSSAKEWTGAVDSRATPRVSEACWDTPVSRTRET